MTVEQYLDRWRDAGIIGIEQQTALRAVVRNERFSVWLELNALLYVGVLAIAAGIGWTVHDHFANAGDIVVLTVLAVVFGGSVYYCFAHDARRTFAFDYVLYLGCLTFAVAVGYVEFRFSLLRENWDVYLLASAVLYFVLAYRFDNRLVLALALSTLAGWFGIRLSMWRVLAGSVRVLLLVYGVIVAAIGCALYRAGIKRHFLDAYLHVAANAVLAALVSGAIEWNSSAMWEITLVLASAASIALGARYSRFAFVVYGFMYGYVGVSAQVVVRQLRGATEVLLYFVLSALAVVAALVAMARRRGRV